jgi:hypothetical protein
VWKISTCWSLPFLVEVGQTAVQVPAVAHVDGRFMGSRRLAVRWCQVNTMTVELHHLPAVGQELDLKRSIV